MEYEYSVVMFSTANGDQLGAQLTEAANRYGGEPVTAFWAATRMAAVLRRPVGTQVVEHQPKEDQTPAPKRRGRKPKVS
jgi:hypothetical protein